MLFSGGDVENVKPVLKIAEKFTKNPWLLSDGIEIKGFCLFGFKKQWSECFVTAYSQEAANQLFNHARAIPQDSRIILLKFCLSKAGPCKNDPQVLRLEEFRIFDEESLPLSSISFIPVKSNRKFL